MPLRINLLAEELALEELRRKDPFKRAIWVAGFLIFLVLLCGLTLFLKIVIAKAELTGLQARWQSLEKVAKQVDEDRRRTIEIEQKLSALLQFNTNRFLWANALNALQQACVDNVQLTHLKSEQIYIQVEAIKAPSPVAGATAAAGKPALATEKIVVHLEGKDYSHRAAEQVPRYKEVIQAFPFFQATLQKTNSILLTSLSPPQTDPSKKTTCVLFGLQLNLQEKNRRLYE
jgi:hypothetical protein